MNVHRLLQLLPESVELGSFHFKLLSPFIDGRIVLLFDDGSFGGDRLQFEFQGFIFFPQSFVRLFQLSI